MLRADTFILWDPILSVHLLTIIITVYYLNADLKKQVGMLVSKNTNTVLVVMGVCVFYRRPWKSERGRGRQER